MSRCLSEKDLKTIIKLADSYASSQKPLDLRPVIYSMDFYYKPDPKEMELLEKIESLSKPARIELRALMEFGRNQRYQLIKDWRHCLAEAQKDGDWQGLSGYIAEKVRLGDFLKKGFYKRMKRHIEVD
jgi:hypothetical protein